MTTSLLLCAALCAGADSEKANLLNNGQLAVTTGKRPIAGWVADKEPKRADPAGSPDGSSTCLRVDIASKVAQHGYIYQHVRVPKGAKAASYVLTGKLKSSVAGIGFFQVKLLGGRKIQATFNVGRGSTEWRTVTKAFAIGDGVDRIQVLCRYHRTARTVGQTVWFADVSLVASDQPAPLLRKPKVDLTGKTCVVLVLGDSTVASYPESSDLRGWGQEIGDLFKDHVGVANLAVSGRSTKTFIKEGRLDKALEIKAQFALIQFGHNDSHGKGKPESTDAATDYRENLRTYVDRFRSKGVEPVFVTPMHRRTFRKDGALSDSLLPYADAMKAVAVEKKVRVVDLHRSSGELFAKLGDAASADLSCRPGDRTHFSEKGARVMADLIVRGLLQLKHPLCKHLKDEARTRIGPADR